MTLMLTGWLLILASVAISALLIARLRPSVWRLGQEPRLAAGTRTAAASLLLLVAGIGAATSHFGYPSEAPHSGPASSLPLSHASSDDESLVHLKDYLRSAGTEEPGSAESAGESLPDVNTMIERLAARLKDAPEDIKGWQMLGWSYFHTARYEQAAAAYARAVEIDPDSMEIKLAYDEAKARASDSASLETATSLRAGDTAKGGDGSGAGRIAATEAMPPRGHDGAIRAMVEGLADRLERAPRDVDGWTHLMRSRVVLGETEIAATVFRKALEVFMDDAAASGDILAAATELGLRAE
jgi:cytochrome c-type biogenesis protein CcmH